MIKRDADLPEPIDHYNYLHPDKEIINKQQAELLAAHELSNNYFRTLWRIFSQHGIVGISLLAGYLDAASRDFNSSTTQIEFVNLFLATSILLAADLAASSVNFSQINKKSTNDDNNARYFVENSQKTLRSLPTRKKDKEKSNGVYEENIVISTDYDDIQPTHASEVDQFDEEKSPLSIKITGANEHETENEIVGRVVPVREIVPRAIKGMSNKRPVKRYVPSESMAELAEAVETKLPKIKRDQLMTTLLAAEYGLLLLANNSVPDAVRMVVAGAVTFSIGRAAFGLLDFATKASRFISRLERRMFNYDLYVTGAEMLREMNKNNTGNK